MNVSSELISRLVYEFWLPSQEIALNNAPTVEDENGSGPFQPQTLNVAWHLPDDGDSWQLVRVALNGPLLEPREIDLGLVTRGTRRFPGAIPEWIQKIVEDNRPPIPRLANPAADTFRQQVEGRRVEAEGRS